jgi:membrane protein
VALVALVLLTAGILGAIGHEEVWTKQVGPQLKPQMLPQVYAGLNATMEKVFHSSSAGLIAFGAALATWEISSGVRTCMSALARIYDTTDDRPWWIRFPVSIAIGLVLTAALVGSILLATVVKGLVHGSWGLPFAVGRWLLAIGLQVAAFGVLVRFAPQKARTTRWASGGAALVVVAWIVQSVLFWWYLKTLANYKTAVGSLLGVYFLTTYLYVGSIILLVGMELDEQLRRDVEGDEERGLLQLVREVV